MSQNIAKRKREIEAVDETDLITLLKNLGLLNEFQDGKMKCHFCKETIHENNLGTILSKDKKILFACDKLKCLANLS